MAQLDVLYWKIGGRALYGLLDIRYIHFDVGSLDLDWVSNVLIQLSIGNRPLDLNLRLCPNLEGDQSRSRRQTTEKACQCLWSELTDSAVAFQPFDG